MEMLGVYDEELVEPLAKVLSNLGVDHAMVVHGRDGFDEISMSDVTTVCEVHDKDFRVYTFDPARYGFTLCRKEDLVGGTPADNAAITSGILAGEQGPRTDAVILNSAAAIHLATRGLTMADAIDVARATIASGKAAEQLAAFVALSNS